MTHAGPGGFPGIPALPPGEYPVPTRWTDRHIVVRGLGELARTSWFRYASTGRVLDGRSFAFEREGFLGHRYHAAENGYPVGWMHLRGFLRNRGPLVWRGVEYAFEQQRSFRQSYSVGRPGMGALLDVRTHGFIGNALRLTVSAGEPVDPGMALFSVWTTVLLVRQASSASNG